jgi:hypothetical protein
MCEKQALLQQVESSFKELWLFLEEDILNEEELILQDPEQEPAEVKKYFGRLLERERERIEKTKNLVKKWNCKKLKLLVKNLKKIEPWNWEIAVYLAYKGYLIDEELKKEVKYWVAETPKDKPAVRDEWENLEYIEGLGYFSLPLSVLAKIKALIGG